MDALKYTLNLLKNKDYTFKEIKDKLKAKGYKDEDINKVIKYIQRYKLINENNFLDRLIEKYTKEKIESKKVLKDKLLKKGFKEEDIDKKLEDIDEYYLAKRVLQKYIKNKENINKERIIRYLSQKGFDYDIIDELIAKNFFINKEDYFE